MKRALLSILIIGFLAVGAFAFTPAKAKAITLNDINSLFEQVKSLKDEIANLKSQLTAQLYGSLSESLQFTEQVKLDTSLQQVTEPTILVAPATTTTNILDKYKDYSYTSLSRLSGTTAMYQIQRALQSASYSPGPIDGVLGPKTFAAYNSWEQAKAAASVVSTAITSTAIAPTGMISLTIIKDAEPNDTQNFAFTVTCVQGSGICSSPQSFTLDDDPNSLTPKSKTLNLGTATYIIKETPVLGWTTKIDCVGGITPQYVSGNQIAVDLGGATKCIFTNTKTQKHKHLINYKRIQKHLNINTNASVPGIDKYSGSIDCYKEMGNNSTARAISGGFTITSSTGTTGIVDSEGIWSVHTNGPLDPDKYTVEIYDSGKKDMDGVDMFTICATLEDAAGLPTAHF